LKSKLKNKPSWSKNSPARLKLVPNYYSNHFFNGVNVFGEGSFIRLFIDIWWVLYWCVGTWSCFKWAGLHFLWII
jgi:hypothetical protein